MKRGWEVRDVKGGGDGKWWLGGGGSGDDRHGHRLGGSVRGREVIY
jgi:hypothetical protein